MKLQVVGYNIVKNGEQAILHCLDLTRYNNTEGYRPFIVNRFGKVNEGLWLSTKVLPVDKSLLNKVIDVNFNANGYPVSVEVVNK